MATIEEFFCHKNVFVTGGTGFMGKVLLEKLLRSCPDLGNIYVLIRPKKGKNPSDRILDITSVPLFDVLKRDDPEKLKKLIPIAGDCCKLNLDLSPCDYKMLGEKVSIVFHSAASIRFNETLTDAAFMNTRGTREVMMLAKNMKNLKALVHVSTCYCQCDKQVVDEVIYPPHADWRQIIEMAENIDEHTLNIFTPKILGELPNTYVFTKSLAEHVINDLGKNLPVVIFRPTIVIASLDDPIPGWIDSFTGPMGLLVAGGKGVVQVSLGKSDSVIDYIPVDVCIKLMCTAAWEKGKSGDISKTSVYNSSSGDKKAITLEKVLKMGFDAMNEFPLSNILWKPYNYTTSSKILYYWLVIFVHLIPAYFLDTVLKISGYQPILMRIHRRVFLTSIALYYFTTKTWHFKHENALWLRKQIVGNDKNNFGLDDIEYSDEVEFFKNANRGARLYLLKETEDMLPQSKKHSRRMWWLDAVYRVLRAAFFLWLLYRSALLQNTFYSIYETIMDINVDTQVIPV